jgi:hypothetical protein
MKVYLRLALILFALFTGIHYWGPSATSAAAQISGTYKIAQSTDLGSEVRLTCVFDLLNPSSTTVTITRFGLPSISAPGQLVTASSNLVVSSHAAAQISLQFLMSKKDFNAWHTAPHQVFVITVVPSGGTPALLNLPLLRTQG